MGRGTRGGKRGAATGGTGATPELNKDLVRRANAAGTVVDYGSATEREYTSNVKEINNMALSAAEKQDAINELHTLTETQLRAEARAVNPYTAGPARFNRAQVDRNSNSAVAARQNTQQFMNNMRSRNDRATREARNKAFASAAQRAIAEGALSFTMDGKTWSRKSRRSKTFASE